MQTDSTVLPASKRSKNLGVGPRTHDTEINQMVTHVQPHADCLDETRSVVSISNHMERLGHDSSEIPLVRDDSSAPISAPHDDSMVEVANQSGTSTGSQGTAMSSKASTLDARIASLSEMNDADRCAELAQPVQVEQVQDVPMDADFNYDTEEELVEDDSNTAPNGTSDMPDLEGSDGDL